MEILKIKEVTKNFGTHTILDNVSFTINEGDIFGIIGQSGSGKTTLLNMLIGFHQPDEGKILYQLDENHKKRNVRLHPFEVKKKFGFASQFPSFYPQLTLRENLIHFGKLYGLNNATLKNNLLNLLDFTELKTHRHKLAGDISVGMQKRLDISCSLIHKPKLLLLDEPTADLDPILQKEIIHLIKQVNKNGITVVIASHHLDDIEQVCNKVALLNRGKLTSWGSLDEIRKAYPHQGCAIHLKAGRDHHLMIEHAKYLPVDRIVDKDDSITLYSTDFQRTLAALITVIDNEGITLEDISIRKPSLSEIFEDLVKEQNLT